MRIESKGDWKPLFIPNKLASYVNDHAIFKDINGKYQLLGTCALGKYRAWKETSFVCASTSNLNTQMVESGLLFKNTKGVKIAPVVYFQEDRRRYHLYFGTKNIFHYTSNTGNTWRKEKNAINGFWPDYRDPSVIKNGNIYLMFATGPNHSIYVWESTDLFNWRNRKTALKLGAGVPRSPNTSCESPKVIKYGNDFLLFTTITPWILKKKENRRNYLITKVFISKDPTNVGFYTTDEENTAEIIATLEAHAPEIVIDNGKYYITTCGWSGYPKPEGVQTEGVYIREIELSKS